MEHTETVLTSDLSLLGTYFREWRLQPSPTKTEAMCFHLNNKLANRRLKIYFDNNIQKYLGVTLDRTLSYKQHLINTAAKICTRNNIIQKLCGTSWGSSASTLRCSALGLVYSAAEYCSPVWLKSAHIKIVDTVLNQTMRIISGTIKSTPIHWLPVLSHIPPPHEENMRFSENLKKIQDNPQLPIHALSNGIDRDRLHSRHPPLIRDKDLEENGLCLEERWKVEWEESAPPQDQDGPRSMCGLSTQMGKSTIPKVRLRR
ncbi:uncharacterized protein LOC126234439 [Schistocerca nitens]|uniref:uncharacterized protein LOC126234439 n=1 Tax=Schistocerca nitens TaxID=7011 RepID=UPI002117B60D|nr:uncharacterized protein LOC126234439 [Schistocerca nitens]